MRTYGELIDISRNGFLVLLGNGNKALLPLGDITQYRLSETMLGRYVHVSTTDLKLNGTIILENKFSFVSFEEVIKAEGA